MEKISFLLKICGLLLVALLLRCDSERLTGYNYEANVLPNSAVITGVVTNIFTGAPVHRATLQIQGRGTETTRDGRFTFQYEIGEDDRLNRPAVIRVSARQYFPLDTQMVVFPRDNVLNIRLVYAAPIILNSSVADSIVTADVFDYQGWTNLDSVFAIGAYWNDSTRVLSNEPFLMRQISIVDLNTARFSTFFPDSVDSSGLVRTNYAIRATDKDGYSEFRNFPYGAPAK